MISIIPGIATTPLQKKVCKFDEARLAGDIYSDERLTLFRALQEARMISLYKYFIVY